MFLALMAWVGCGKPAADQSSPNKPTPPPAAPALPISTPERAEAAKALFERAVSDFHNLSANALPDKRTELLEGAATRYQQLVDEYPEQKRWCAQALRNLAGTQAELGDPDGALKFYDRVAAEYSEQEFEVLQAWKAAADLLWDLDRKAPARAYYAKIVDRFDREEIPPVYKVILNLAKKRAGE